MLPLGSNSKPLKCVDTVTEWLSAFFGLPVTSSMDAFGNWTISVNGGAPIPLTFSLPEVVVTVTGKVIDYVSKDELYYGPTWAPPELQNLFATSGGATAYPPTLNGAIGNHSGSGPDGMSCIDIIGMMNTSLGLATSSATVAANAAKLELELTMVRTNYIFGSIDIAGNILEIVSNDQDALHVWEDIGQIGLGFALTFTPVGPATLIAGSIVLAAWELWEYKRDH